MPTVPGWPVGGSKDFHVNSRVAWIFLTTELNNIHIAVQCVALAGLRFAEKQREEVALLPGQTKRLGPD